MRQFILDRSLLLEQNQCPDRCRVRSVCSNRSVAAGSRIKKPTSQELSLQELGCKLTRAIKVKAEAFKQIRNLLVKHIFTFVFHTIMTNVQFLLELDDILSLSPGTLQENE